MTIPNTAELKEYTDSTLIKEYTSLRNNIEYSLTWAATQNENHVVVKSDTLYTEVEPTFWRGYQPKKDTEMHAITKELLDKGYKVSFERQYGTFKAVRIHISW